ncbi:shikimate kinase [Actinotalea sp. M2MS4P-6]|uniref:shikimate kinase n=1 Tax=Actinotalea sp. M2MS4P-6 TaxID=2983762 RepID=UPI0021E429B0|nr:shikimate kinase [Actinotalea sp. M2MS4P-6]MCV2394583.1 shikimate kinase [Actinotalea sp. M2MS4P-6]
MTAVAPRVVLVGPPGAEVTATAAEVADRLGLALVDTDALVEEIAGTTVAELFWDRGEEVFRAFERDAVVRALEQGGVVALGGGAVVDPATRDALDAYRASGGVVVFCDVSLAHAVPRLGFNAPRPVGLGNPRAQWQTHMDARRPLYEAVADHRVDTDERTVTEVAQMVLDRLADEGSTP